MIRLFFGLMYVGFGIMVATLVRMGVQMWRTKERDFDSWAVWSMAVCIVLAGGVGITLYYGLVP